MTTAPDLTAAREAAAAAAQAACRFAAVMAATGDATRALADGIHRFMAARHPAALGHPDPRCARCHPRANPAPAPALAGYNHRSRRRTR